MQVHNPATSDLKCPTCFLDFSTSQQHKQHYKSDFHRYNLKRKMVKLAPASLEQFKAKKVEAQAQEAVELKCNQCGKRFNSVNTFNQHVETKKHNPNAIVNKQNKDKKDKATLKFIKNHKLCIFCQKQSTTFAQNLRHMQASHSFSIPEQKYCTNPQGLIQYLQQKVEVGFMCITCENKNAKDFSTGSAVRKHMNDKGHVSMKTDEGYDEYLEYYDFSSQFKEIIESQKGRQVHGIQYTTLKIIAKQGQMENEDKQEQGEWQDEDSSSEEDQQKQIKQKQGEQDEQWQSESDQDEEKQAKKSQKLQMPDKKKSKIKTYHIMRPTQTSNGQLLLPNGKILGHRKFRYLYRQTYREKFWLNKDIKALGYGFADSALVARQRVLQLAKHDKLLYNYKNRWNKKQLRNGMANNTQKYFRTSNSL